jgi:hypothetical protein
MTRRKLGDRAICERCTLEIEFIGRGHKRLLPALTIPTGPWHDRGGNRFCPYVKASERNVKHLHTPHTGAA